MKRKRMYEKEQNNIYINIYLSIHTENEKKQFD